jgi:uncharacterized protein
MRVEGEHHFAASRAAVWQRLQDPHALQEAIPGCVEFAEVAPDSYDMTVEVRIGPIRGSFAGNVTLKDREPESRYILLAQGGGRPGRVNGQAEITLEEAEDGTLVAYDAELTLRGPVARVGGRLLSTSARGMARQFFSAIDAQAGATNESGPP